MTFSSREGLQNEKSTLVVNSSDSSYVLFGLDCWDGIVFRRSLDVAISKRCLFADWREVVSNTLGAIVLSSRNKRTDIPRVLCEIDFFNYEDRCELENLHYKAMLVDVDYEFQVYPKTIYRPRSPEQCLRQRLRNLETRAKKASSLFWKDIVDAEISKRPRYYSIDGVREQRAEMEKYQKEVEQYNKPAFSLDGLRNWLRTQSPFINPELDKMMAFRYRCLEREKRIKAMTPEEREAYYAKSRENNPLVKNAFEAEGEREMLKLMRI